MSKNFLVLAAVTAVVIVGLTACSPAVQPEPPAPVETEAAPVEDTSDATSSGAEMLSVQESCELFNSTWADYGDVDPEDPDGYGYMDIGLALEPVLPTIPEETYGMFTVLRAAAYEASIDGVMSEETQGLMTTWVLDASGACTDAGVTLQL
ncbi:hypothetical protein DC31_00645 [Microbacterium sp. CH12i]|uniref:hypothetical protein n=1 Tax=Microbacterium sp. CH12i TaxID=1479651 RepID=UPI0004619E41|nr:hypothetical protein [Microbacterium sp. CH12i]KDA07000.1 hypothetical protein DC31_00645 [Microbacterium sp. CH12i]